MTDQLVEVRNYTLAPGATGAFVEHFERHFLESQEELGMDIVGQFTVPGDDGRFVWVRRFSRPSTRGEALQRFYTGPVWREFGPRANELMVDHTDVHLLTPDPSAPAFAAGHVPHAQRAGPAGDAEPGWAAAPASTVVAAFYDLDGLTLPADTAAAMTAATARTATTAITDANPEAGAVELGRHVSARVPNDFPRLPVHEDLTVAVWLLADHAGGQAATAAAEAVAGRQDLTLRTIQLTPTSRSTLR